MERFKVRPIGAFLVEFQGFGNIQADEQSVGPCMRRTVDIYGVAENRFLVGLVPSRLVSLHVFGRHLAALALDDPDEIFSPLAGVHVGRSVLTNRL